MRSIKMIDNRLLSIFKGALIGFVVDTAIRRETSNRSSLDEVMREMYRDGIESSTRGPLRASPSPVSDHRFPAHGFIAFAHGLHGFLAAHGLQGFSAAHGFAPSWCSAWAPAGASPASDTAKASASGRAWARITHSARSRISA